MKIVHIDYGHGGKDPGALGNGLQEKDLTMAIGKKTARILERHGVKISYSRIVDEYLDLTTRANKANAAKADVMVSFHINSATNPAARGFEVFTTKGQTKADELAQCIAEQLIKDFPDVPFRADKSDGDLDKESNFTVITKSKMPAVLLELGFIVNPIDANMLRTQQDKIANSVATGILKYLGIGTAKEEKFLPPGTKIGTIKMRIAGKPADIEGIFVDGVNYVPIRIAEQLGHKVSWEQSTKTVVIE